MNIHEHVLPHDSCAEIYVAIYILWSQFRSDKCYHILCRKGRRSSTFFKWALEMLSITVTVFTSIENAANSIQKQTKSKDKVISDNVKILYTHLRIDTCLHRRRPAINVHFVQCSGQNTYDTFVRATLLWINRSLAEFTCCMPVSLSLIYSLIVSIEWAVPFYCTTNIWSHDRK